jgi:anti-sigma regulatory factor (Ser/Thr protein kinase)
MRYDVVSSFGCDTAQVALARSWVQDELASRLPAKTPEDLVDDATLIVSELLTNAIRAGCELMTVGLALNTDCLRVSVSDDAPGIPTIRPAAPDADAGRGLPIVSSLAQEWGVDRPGPFERRKEVWATLAFS